MRSIGALTWNDKWDGHCKCKLCQATEREKRKLRNERVRVQMELLRKEEKDNG